MIDGLNMRFLGAGNAAAHELGNSAAVLEHDDGSPLLLIDCGPTVVPAFLDRYGRLPGAIYVTHTHLDHVGGLEDLFYRLAGEHRALPPARLFVPAQIMPRLQHQFGEDVYEMTDGGMNFWDRFQPIPVGAQFWHAGMSFAVFAVDHHGYQRAFGLALRGHFLFTGDTRPVPDVLARFAADNECVFHDCALRGSPSHTGLADIERSYPAALRPRLVLYHYESLAAATAMRRAGFEVAEAGSLYSLDSALRTPLRRVG